MKRKPLKGTKKKKALKIYTLQPEPTPETSRHILARISRVAPCSVKKILSGSLGSSLFLVSKPKSPETSKLPSPKP